MITQFPLQQPREPSKEPVAPGRFGFGTTEAFDAFTKKAMSLNGSQELLLAINIATLLRNNISTETYADGKKVTPVEKPRLDAASVVAKTRQQIVEIANEFANICDIRFKDRKHHILFYLTDPTKQVPVEWQRPRTAESMVKLDAVTRAFCNVVHSSDQTNNNVQLHIRLADKMRAPSYRALAEAFKLWTFYKVDVHLISHEPLDYHVAQVSGRNGFLYRSHTGAVVPLTPKDLGQVVFKNDQIPFYRLTHTLLGDKSLIKGTLAKKDKDRFLKMAQDERWGLRTSEYLEVKVKENGFPLIYKLQ